MTMPQRYAHPTLEATARAMERFDSMNQEPLAGLKKPPMKLPLDTISAASDEPVLVTH